VAVVDVCVLIFKAGEAILKPTFLGEAGATQQL